MNLERPATPLTIVIGESDHYRHHSLCSEILDPARRCGRVGCSVFRGTDGFGASGHLHTARLRSLPEDLPVAIAIIDAPERVEAFSPRLDELLSGSRVILDDVDVIHDVANPASRSSKGARC